MDGAFVDEGRAYLYLGGPGGLSNPATLTQSPANQANAQFGQRAAGVGDVNGDGFADVVIAADHWDGQQTDEGRAYLYLGRAGGMGTAPAWTADPTDQVSAYFGAPAKAGDVNGDGFGDVLVGLTYVGMPEGNGTAKLYLGTANGLEATPAWVVTDVELPRVPVERPVFEWTVTSAGDVNGDGFSDIAIGMEPLVHVFHGSAAGLDVVDSYVSLTEVSEYAKGMPEELLHARLYPTLPPEGKPAFCFYPMSKRRQPQQKRRGGDRPERSQEQSYPRCDVVKPVTHGSLF